MNLLPQNEERWEQHLRSTLGTAPSANFGEWKARNQSALQELTVNETVAGVDSEAVFWKRKSFLRVSRAFAAVAALIVVALFLWPSGSVLPTAYSQTIAGIDQVQQLAWTVTSYMRYTSRDGLRTWIHKQREDRAFRAPGQFRETLYDDNDEPVRITITDLQLQQTLELNVKDKKALLRLPGSDHSMEPPFEYVGKIIREQKVDGDWSVRSLKLAGQMNIDGKNANIIRATLQSGFDKQRNRHDYFFDTDTKAFLGVWGPNDPSFDLDSIRSQNNLSEKEWSKGMPLGGFWHEVNTSPNLSEADFSLDPPAGYGIERYIEPTISEDEFIAFLRAASEFADGVFPDVPLVAYDRDSLNAEWEKPENARSLQANTLIALVDKFRMREIYQSPIKRFIDDQTQPDSFHYVGSGVKVGNSSDIVCWYRLKRGTGYRAVYGDLHVKDVSSESLPAIMP